MVEGERGRGVCGLKQQVHVGEGMGARGNGLLTVMTVMTVTV